MKRFVAIDSCVTLPALWATLVLGGCGGGSTNTSGAPAGLDPNTVQSIPPGNATGSAFSGVYQAQRITKSCSAACATTETTLDVPVSACNVGAVRSLTLQITQDGGVLTAKVDDTPSLYSGSINADGTYALGAYATQDGTLQITAFSTGMLSPPTQVVGSAQSYTWGTLNGTLSCSGTYEIVVPAQ